MPWTQSVSGEEESELLKNIEFLLFGIDSNDYKMIFKDDNIAEFHYLCGGESKIITKTYTLRQATQSELKNTQAKNIYDNYESRIYSFTFDPYVYNELDGECDSEIFRAFIAGQQVHNPPYFLIHFKDPDNVPYSYSHGHQILVRSEPYYGNGFVQDGEFYIHRI